MNNDAPKNIVQAGNLAMQELDAAHDTDIMLKKMRFHKVEFEKKTPKISRIKTIRGKDKQINTELLRDMDGKYAKRWAESDAQAVIDSAIIINDAIVIQSSKIT